MSDKRKDKFCSKILNENISKLLTKHKLTLTELHRNTNVPMATLKRMQSDSNANPTISSLLPIAEFFNVSVNQLVNSQIQNGTSPGINYDTENWQKIPHYTWHQIAANELETNDFIQADVDSDRGIFAITIDDEQFNEMLYGCILIVDPAETHDASSYVVTQTVVSGAVSIYRLNVKQEGQIIMMPLNKLDSIEIFEPHRFNIMGVVIQIIYKK